jgi:hypothetical protein
LWTEYPAIGEELNGRTTAIQTKLGLNKEDVSAAAATSNKKTAEGVGPNSARKQSISSASAHLLESRTFSNSSWKLGEGYPEFEDEEADSLDIRRSVTRAVTKVKLHKLPFNRFSVCNRSHNLKLASSFGCKLRTSLTCLIEFTLSLV